MEREGRRKFANTAPAEVARTNKAWLRSWLIEWLSGKLREIQKAFVSNLKLFPSMVREFTHKKARSLMGVGFSPESNALILFNGRKIIVIL